MKNCQTVCQNNNKNSKYLIRIMKLYVIVTSLTISKLMSFDLEAQISVQLENSSLKIIMEEIEKQSQFSFFYNNKLIDHSVKKSLHVYEMEIGEVIDLLFDGTNIDFRFFKSQIILFPKNNSTIAKQMDSMIKKEKRRKISSISAEKLSETLDVDQQPKISGRVVDQDGNPLPGVSVYVKGSRKGVSTEFDGGFVIEVEPNQLLVFSYIGMESQEITITDQKFVEIVLIPSLSDLDEVVLTGYQRLTRERATGSMSKLNSDDIDRVVSENVLNALEGSVSGLLIQNNAQGEPSITIRGISSLSGRNDPLVVVDGFPISSGNQNLNLSSSGLNFITDIDNVNDASGSLFGTLNPRDIKSITVLKDAAAASIWGVRSANGVIVIETYSGRDRAGNNTIKASFTQDFTFGLSKPDLDDFYLMDSSQTIDLVTELYDAGRVSLSTNYEALSGIFRARDLEGSITDQEAEVLIDGLRKVDARQQWSDLLLREEMFQRSNLYISGNTEKMNFLITAMSSTKQSQHEGDNEDQYSIRGVIGANDVVLEGLDVKLDYTTLLTNRKENGLSYSNFRGLFPYESFLDENGNYLHQYRSDNRAYPHQMEMYDERGYLNWRFNWLQEQRALDETVENDLHRIQARLDYEINPNIKLGMQYQYENSNSFQSRLNTLEKFSVRQQINRLTTYSAEEGLSVNFPRKPNLKLATSDLVNWLWRSTISFDYNFLKKGNISGLFGGEVQKRTGDFIKQDLWGYDPTSLVADRLDYQLLGSQGFTIYPYFRQKTDSRFVSGFSSIGITWDDKYDLTVSGRLDRTNFFGSDPKNRTSPFWSAGLGWLLSKENFLHTSAFINHLKLRATYGFNGNIASTEGKVLIASSRTSVDRPNETYLRPTTLPNPNLKWERIRTINFGVDFGLFDNQLWGSLEYYLKKGEDIFARKTLDPTFAPTTYISMLQQNFGETKNQGIDLHLSSKILDRGSFIWNSTLNFSSSTSEVIKGDTGNTRTPNYSNEIYHEGDPVDALYVYRYAGLDENGEALRYGVNGDLVGIREFEVELEKKVAGVINPKYFGGLINNLSYKNFDMSISFSYSFGHVIRGPVGRNRNYQDYRSGVSKILIDRWREPGDEEHTDIPGIGTTPNRYRSVISSYALSDRNVDDGDFIRLRYLSFGYRFSDNILKKLFIDNAKINLQFTNLWLWTANKWDVDPEYYGGNMNANVGAPSPPSTATLSLKLDF